jgi:HSP20 family molecular chaperone IbpA
LRLSSLFARDLPGLQKEDVKIEVTHDELTIEGERKLEKEEQKEGVHRTEPAYGKFFRRIEIPEYVKAEQTIAVFKNGLLEIEMPTIPVPRGEETHRRDHRLTQVALRGQLPREHRGTAATGGCPLVSKPK